LYDIQNTVGAESGLVREEEQRAMAYFTSWASCHYCESSDVEARLFDAEC